MADTGIPTIGADLAWLDQVIDRARRNAEHLTDGQIRFVDDMLAKTARYGERAYFSARQRRFAEAIDAALDFVGAPAAGEDREGDEA